MLQLWCCCCWRMRSSPNGFQQPAFSNLFCQQFPACECARRAAHSTYLLSVTFEQNQIRRANSVVNWLRYLPLDTHYMCSSFQRYECLHNKFKQEFQDLDIKESHFVAYLSCKLIRLFCITFSHTSIFLQ